MSEESTVRQRTQWILVPDSESLVPSAPEAPLPRVIDWNQAPTWVQDNTFIRTGFRPASWSYLGSLGSLTYLHNETGNIYSHLIGAIAIPAAGVLLRRHIIESHRYKTAGRSDVIVFGVFFVGAVGCLGMSATYHTLSSHSPRVHDLWLRLDVTGIAVLTVATFVPAVYYGFYCEPLLRRVYWTMVCDYCYIVNPINWLSIDHYSLRGRSCCCSSSQI